MSDPTSQDERDKYFLHFLKYEVCIYAAGIVGAVSQILIGCIIVAHLALGLNFGSEEMTTKGVRYSFLGIFILVGTAFSEILLLRAVNQRILRYIQWWMFSTFVLLLFCMLLTVIIGLTLFNQGVWITLSFVYLLIRFPFQMYFVDCFAQVEIFHKEANTQNPYVRVLYRRLS